MSAGAAGYDLATIRVLWKRDLLLFASQRSRLLGALLPPVLLWLAIGAGIAPSFSGAGQMDYMEYLFPGMLLMLMLQVSISATMSVIEDRREGLMQGVLVAPGSRTSLVLGKSFGSATVALIHAALFALLAPFAGFAFGDVSWPFLLLVTTLAGLTLVGIGFLVAWTLDSVQGYHVVMNLLLLPMWILSGAMFPPEGLHPAIGAIVRLNPLSYGMAAMRRAFYDGSLPEGTSVAGSTLPLELAVLVFSAIAAIVAACLAASRRAYAR